MVIKKNEINNDTNVVAKKRGRKSKKELEAIAQQQQISKYTMQNNINVIIEDSNKDNGLSQIEDILNAGESYVDNEIINTITQSLSNENENDVTEDKHIPKKRGRKPKGGKIIQQVVSLDNNKEVKPNVILHLKCSIKDLQTNSLLGNDIQSYNFSSVTQLSYDILNDNNINSNKTEQFSVRQENTIEENDYDEDDVILEIFGKS